MSSLEGEAENLGRTLNRRFNQLGDAIQSLKDGPKVEILHERNPDMECSVRVWVDGVELKGFRYDDIDPGAGHRASDWDESHQEAIANPDLSDAFRAALDQAYSDGRDSEYVEKD